MGLEVAHICNASDVLLTDVPEAMDILNSNVAIAKRASGSGRITTAVLDWQDDLPVEISNTCYDIVVISECTYNTNSIPALVRTVSALAEKSLATLVVISTKVRHDSEAMFFDLMTRAGLAELEHINVLLPDKQRTEMDQSLESVDIYTFSKDVLIG